MRSDTATHQVHARVRVRGRHAQARRRGAHPLAHRVQLDARPAAAGRPAHRAAGAFSRGMAQRLAIARGLVHDPSVVLLDEPFTGLDRSAAQKLSERLAGLHTAPRTQIVVTHDLGRVAELADRALLLVAGRIARELGGEELETPALERAWAEVTEGPL